MPRVDGAVRLHARAALAAKVSHMCGGKIVNLPPRPARIHAFVNQCSSAEVISFSEKLDFLNLILKSKLDIPAEEFTAAVIRSFAEVQPNPQGFLIEAGRELARLLSKDYSQLKAILERIRP